MSNNTLQPVQVSPLPTGSGGNNATKAHLNNINTTLTMMNAQSNADSKYDPPVPKPITNQVIVGPREAFCGQYNACADTLLVVGILCIVYGIFKK